MAGPTAAQSHQWIAQGGESVPSTDNIILEIRKLSPEQRRPAPAIEPAALPPSSPQPSSSLASTFLPVPAQHTQAALRVPASHASVCVRQHIRRPPPAPFRAPSPRSSQFISPSDESYSEDLGSKESTNPSRDYAPAAPRSAQLLDITLSQSIAITQPPSSTILDATANEPRYRRLPRHAGRTAQTSQVTDSVRKFRGDTYSTGDRLTSRAIASVYESHDNMHGDRGFVKSSLQGPSSQADLRPRDGSADDP
ncbi:hypothetical protein EDB84DRAFT_1570167 [Lactarius hengduanensis]|nr:hypothetical protein EDB84DRAFT_1570167 [Lactarius hengduanensis]